MGPVEEIPRQRTAKTRSLLLRAAGRVFAKNGYHGSTIDAVAAAAGLTKGAVYYHFGSKQDLFLTLLQERLEDRLRDVEAAYAAEPSVAGARRRAARGFFDRLERDPNWVPLFFEFVAYAGRDPRLRTSFGRRFIVTARGSLARVISGLFERTGTVPSIPAEHLAIAVDALASGLALERMFTSDVPDQLFEDVLQLLFRAATRPT